MHVSLNLRNILLFCLIFCGPLARSENDFLVKTYSGITNGRMCWPFFGVSNDDVNSLDGPCPPNPLTMFNEEIFNWRVFQSSAEMQLQKNLCIQQRLDVLMHSPKLVKTWFKFVAKAWLGKKKAELILSKCGEISYNTNKRLGARINPNFTPSPATPEQSKNPHSLKSSIDKKWLDLCADKNALATLAVADNLFDHALPVIGSPEFFNVVEENRSVILNKNTGKPITEAEILGADLSNLKFLAVDDKKMEAVRGEMKQKMALLRSERRDVNIKLKNNRDKKGIFNNLDEPMRDYLFEDGTVYEVLKRSNQMVTSDLTGETIEMSSGAKCIMNSYELSIGGDMAEIVGGSFLLGATFAKLRNLASLELTLLTGKIVKTTTMMKQIGLGSYMAGAAVGLREAAKTCPESGAQYQHTKLSDRNKGQASRTIEVDSLPEDLDFNFYELKGIPKAKTPACKNLPKNSIVEEFHRFGCISNVILSVAPLVIALPTLAVSL